MLQGAGGHKLTATLIALGSVALFGLGVGRALQLAHARAWGLDLRKAKIMDQARYLQALLAILLAILLYAIEGKVLQDRPSWIAWAIVRSGPLGVFAFFVWVPRLLLHKGDRPA